MGTARQLSTPRTRRHTPEHGKRLPNLEFVPEYVFECVTEGELKMVKALKKKMIVDESNVMVGVGRPESEVTVVEVLEGHRNARSVEAGVSVIEPLFGLALYERIEIPSRSCAKENATRIEDKGYEE